jgi:hypothetical protein
VTRVIPDREIGAALRRAGLTTRMLAAWAGTDRISALPSRLPRLLSTTSTTTSPVAVRAGSDRHAPAIDPPPAAAALAMFVGGARVPVRKLGLLGDALAVLVERGLVVIEGDLADATVTIVPSGSSLLVCDRLDAPASEGLVCWPDDSSHHLAACLPPGRRDKWLDLGCGSGFAPLARPELAISICGTDINTRALDHAALGAALSGVRLEVFAGDVGANVPASWRGTCELVSCNAPIPAMENVARTARAIETVARTAPVWRHAARDVVERMVDAAASFAAREATIVLHAAHDALAAALAHRRGHRTIVRYTPDEVLGFAIAWWEPDGEERLVQRVRFLTPDAPHLTFADRG